MALAVSSFRLVNDKAAHLIVSESSCGSRVPFAEFRCSLKEASQLSSSKHIPSSREMMGVWHDSRPGQVTCGVAD